MTLHPSISIPEAEIVNVKDLLQPRRFPWIPQSKHGKQIICIAVILALALISTTGILCASGVCTDIGAASEDIAMRYETSRMALPNYTLATIQSDSNSPQARAFQWIMQEYSQEGELWERQQAFALSLSFMP